LRRCRASRDAWRRAKLFFAANGWRSTTRLRYRCALWVLADLRKAAARNPLSPCFTTLPPLSVPSCPLAYSTRTHERGGVRKSRRICGQGKTLGCALRRVKRRWGWAPRQAYRRGGIAPASQHYDARRRGTIFCVLCYLRRLLSSTVLDNIMTYPSPLACVVGIITRETSPISLPFCANILPCLAVDCLNGQGTRGDDQVTIPTLRLLKYYGEMLRRRPSTQPTVAMRAVSPATTRARRREQDGGGPLLP